MYICSLAFIQHHKTIPTKMHPLISKPISIYILVLTLYLKCLMLVTRPMASAASSSLITDKEALISFKSRLINPGPLISWNPSDSTPCNWTGVICNGFPARVTELDLSDFGLQGAISPHIGNLSSLSSLQLQKNQLRGSLSPEITNNFRLSFVNVSFNLLEGEIPVNISNLVELQVFDLMANKISGRIPEELSRLEKLQVLNLARNLFWGDIPVSISNISSLTDINFGTNSLTGGIPSELSKLRNLKRLDLTINILLVLFLIQFTTCLRWLIWL